MTIQELIDKLRGFPQETEIVGTWDCGWADIDNIFEENGIVYLNVSSYRAFPHPDEKKTQGGER